MTVEWKWQGRIAAAALVCATAACGGGEAKEPESAPAAAVSTPTRLVNVEVESAVAMPFTDRIGIVGIIAANRDVTVSAEESGIVRELFVDKGAVVKARQPIMKIDDALLQAQLRQQRADAALARETFERQRRLWEEEKIGTEMAYLQAKYAAERAAANVQLLEERVERTTIRAPVAGVMDARLIEIGSMVAPGTPVARIVDASTVKVLGGVPERYAADVRTSAPARISFDALGGHVVEGRIAFVGTAIDEEDRTFPVEVTMRNPGRVKPGMVATVEIAARQLDAAVVVPQEAVVRAENGYIVYVAVQRGEEIVAEARPVVVGASQRGRSVIASGLAEGEDIIVVGQQKVAPGDRLQIVERRGGESS